MSLPDAKARLQAHLGHQFCFADWKSAFDIVFEAEDDIPAAAAAIEKMATQAIAHYPATMATSSPNPSIAPHASFSQLQDLEADLMCAIDSLQQRKHIHGTAPTLEDLLNLIEETEIGHSDYWFPGGDDEIVAEALHMITGMDIQDVEVDDEVQEAEEEGEDEGLSVKEGQRLCERLEKLCLHHSGADGVSTLALQQQLHKLQAHLCQLESASQTQATLDQFWTTSTSSVP
ncbi:hypothetical protein EDB85DRAFT_894205 [Lactarius pseudohatsudake]|nr:hypothetical protein EDB85DRAFT_894205 [Lactarius pseudohatsudake]